MPEQTISDDERSNAELAQMWLKGERTWWNDFVAMGDQAEALCRQADMATANAYASLALADAINEYGARVVVSNNYYDSGDGAL